MEFDFTFGGFGLEIGGHSAYRECHEIASHRSSCG
jgi:hypothetical protein